MRYILNSAIFWFIDVLGCPSTQSMKSRRDEFALQLHHCGYFAFSLIIIRAVRANSTEVYSNAAQQLEAGSYSIPIQPQQIASGTYMLQLLTGIKASTVKIIKVD